MRHRIPKVLTDEDLQPSIRTGKGRNSNGSGFSDTGSMERPKIATTGSAAAAAASAAAADTRKKSEEASASKESRIDARQVIDDLIKSANLEHDENAEGTRPYSTIFSQHV